ncbi:alpha-2-macroglobulin-like [Procambarus clarkii]|uniref:alpha-2-macroglobulin-like n=1 Tax=Procambarus clarkii TaxID=6728 RepID=UPI00374371F5
MEDVQHPSMFSSGVGVHYGGDRQELTARRAPHRGYVVTTPKQWVAGTTAQLCVVVDDPSAPAGKLTVAVTAYDYQQLPEKRNINIIPQTTLDIPAGRTGSCYDVSVLSSSVYTHSLHVAGVVGGAKLTRTVSLTLKSTSDITFVQTDKYLYEPSQNVKFRILTLTGPYLSVSTDPYPEVWVQTPAGTRVAQWKNVDNTAGLVHLDFDLADEPEKGLYTLFVKTPRGQQQSVTFKVEEFVLPRYEVVLKPPAYILGTDEAFTFTVCANYTFGQPVKGNLSLTLDTNQRRKCKVDVTNNVTKKSLERTPSVNSLRAELNTNTAINVLVWYTRQDGEVVADSRELEVDKCLSNTVNVTWSASRVQPGEQASLSLSSEPDSVCSLGVVDRSTELLAVNPDPISLEAVFNFAGSFDVGRWPGSQIDDYKHCEKKRRKRIAGAKPESLNIEFATIDPERYHYYSEYVDALHMFDNSGLFVFSDLTLETRPCEEERRPYSEGLYLLSVGAHVGGFGSGLAGDIAPAAARPQSPPPAFATDSASKKGSEQQPDVPRTNFPETWLWDIIVVPSSGVSTQQVTVPDTITQWVGKAVCAHPQKGVGLSQRKSITTFTPFFVDLTLPPSLKRGEILPVKMSVFNYLDQPIPVSVRVQESEEYQILEEATEQIVLGKRSSCVPAHDKVVHIVRIKPLVIGEVNISVAAFVDHEYSQPCGSGDSSINRRDSLIKPITVEAEGFLREKSWSKYICSKDFETGEDSLEAWELETPQVMVEGSERGWVTAVGDLIALTLENLGSLIRMPYGCGEQNMINFVPNIFIMQYLKASNQTTPETTRRLLTYMKTGYQRELLYRRGDGSFSAFGNADDSGSTWLSAFVLKSFSQAQQFIVIDKNDLNQTSTWLQSNQREDGCFNNSGKVFHKAMKGGIDGSDSPVPLTAYVMIALLEANDQSCSQADCLAAQCLQADSSSDPYVMALKAYAFALARLPEAEVILQKLLEQAVVTKNSTHWELPKGPGKTKAVGVETAGYAIMAMMTLDPKQYEQQARKVVKWITAQRNGQGGFYSTQDTVVALQALALYETHLYQGPLNVVATVTASGLAHPFTVTNDNKLLQQLVKLPTVPTKVSITMEGQGCAVLQAVLRYNIPEAEASDAFDMTVNTNTVPDDKCVTKRITVCASYRLPDGKSNMAVIEVNLISGYIPEKDDLKELLKKDKNIKRYDVDGSKIAFYIEELIAKDTCANFRVIRDIEVEEVKPGTVRLYDYYQPEFQISKSYTLPPPTECR